MKKTLSIFFLTTLVLTACGQTIFDLLPPSQKDLTLEWHPAITSSLAIYTLCEDVLDIGERFHQGQLDISETKIEIENKKLWIHIFSDIKDKENWQPSNVVAPYIEKITTDGDLLTEKITQLPSQSAKSEDNLLAISEICNSFSETIKEVEIAVMDAGMTEATLNKIKKEFLEGTNAVWD